MSAERRIRRLTQPSAKTAGRDFDFSLIGILSKLSGILAENGIGIFAVSTFNTDYILVKEENFERAMDALANAGYTVV